MVRLLAALVLVSALSCVTLSPEQRYARDLDDPNARTLCVEDASVGFGAVTVRTDGGPTFHPTAGETVCRRVTVLPGGMLLRVTSNGGGMAGPLDVSVLLRTVDDRCTVWVIGTRLETENSLVPCHWRKNAKPRAVIGYDADPGVSGTWAGFTQCEGFPASFLNVTHGVVPTEKEGMVRRHEEVHRAQMRRYASCDDWKRDIARNPSVRIDHEAEAHCESARWEYARGAHPSLLMAMLEQAGWFSWYFWNGNTRPALDAIAAFCR